MSFEIKKIYTDNPYVDEMVYYSRLMGINTTLKLQSVADNNETVESLKRAGLYISCVEGTAKFHLFDKVSASALMKVGITDPVLMDSCLNEIQKVPLSKRDALTKVLAQEYIENYEELNPYYRMLHGLPPIGQVDYVKNWTPPDGVKIDLSKPIHEMSKAEVSILDRYGVLDELIDKDPVNNQYMMHLGAKSIDYYLARRAQRFDPLYVPTIDSDAIEHMYKDKLNDNKFYVLRAVYSEAYNYNSDYYDNFMAVFIVLITVIDIISRVQEFIARKEIFDIRSVQYIFKSYGVPFFADIPLKYQIAMVKNLHTLLKYKSTAKCMVSICSLFGFKNIKIFKYYLLRDRKIDLKTGDYLYKTDEEGNEDLDAEFELKFIKLPLDEDLDDYIRVGGNYVDYDEITYGDAKWDGGLNHDMVMKQILQEEFNFTRTKYISIDSMYDIAKMAAQQTYFFNFLYDNVDLESMLTIQIPYIEAGREFNVADVFTLLTVLTYYYRGVKDTIMDTQSKVLYVNGFNFKADLAALAEAIGPKTLPCPNHDPHITDPGSTLHAQEQLKNFQIPEASIPSFGEMMDIFVNNMNIRDELIKGMNEADNKRVYDVYKMLYDSLCTVELTMDYYKNPETGDFYRDSEGDATYSEFLKHKDPSLYYIVAILQDFEDDMSRNQYIANLIDSIVYALEEYIDTDEFQGLFSNLPVISAESVKQYISMVINFYKSYKVDFLGMNTIYTIDDKNEGVIRIIDDMILNRYFQRNEFLNIYEKVCRMRTTMTLKEKLQLTERLYLDISTWKNLHFDDNIGVKDEIYELIAKLVLYTILKVTEKITGIKVDKVLGEIITPKDLINLNTYLNPKDDLGFLERIWIYPEDANWNTSFYAQKLDPKYEGRPLMADEDGYPAPAPEITDEIDPDYHKSTYGIMRLVTEKAAADYTDEQAIPKTDVSTSIDEEDPSDSKLIAEKAMVEALSFRVIRPDESDT